MVGWLESDPKRKKTAGGVNRFINSWLAKSQNRGPQQNGGFSNGKNIGDANVEVARRVIAGIEQNRSRVNGNGNLPARIDGREDIADLFLPAGDRTL